MLQTSWPGAAAITHDAVRTHLLQAALQSETMLQRARRLLVLTILHNNIIRSYRWVATTSLVADISSTLDLAQFSRDPLKCRARRLLRDSDVVSISLKGLLFLGGYPAVVAEGLFRCLAAVDTELLIGCLPAMKAEATASAGSCDMALTRVTI